MNKAVPGQRGALVTGRPCGRADARRTEAPHTVRRSAQRAAAAAVSRDRWALRGREEHLEQIKANLRKAGSERRSRVLLVKAAPGGGKTRLLAEVAEVARGMGFAVAGATATDVVESIQKLLGEVHEHRTVLVALDDLHLSADSVLAVLCDLVLAAADRPVVWLLAFTSEPGDASSSQVSICLDRLRGRVAVEPVRRLGPVSGDALAQLVADHVDARPDTALLTLVESVNVTPCAVIEVVRGLLEDGDIDVADGHARAVATPSACDLGGPSPVPRRVSLRIEHSLRRLSERTVKTLRLAAVLGSPVVPEELSAMLGESPAVLLSAVDEAVRQGFLVCDEDTFAFRAEPIWRVLLDSVPPPVRALLRRQAAALMLTRSDGVTRAAVQLAHVVRPGDADDLEVIAEGARRMIVGDPAAAASLATRCVRLLEPTRAERMRMASTAVEALARAGDLEEAVALAENVIEDATNPAVPAGRAPVEAVAGLRASLATAILLQGDTHSAARTADQALVRSGAESRETVIAHLAASHLNGDDAAVDLAREIVRAPDRHEKAVRVGAMTVLGLERWGSGQLADALGVLHDAVVLNHAEGEAQILDPRWYLALFLAKIGEHERAEAVVRGFAQAATPVAEAALKARVHLVTGRLDEVEAAARIVVGTDDRQPSLLAPQAWLALGHLALRRGTPAEAENCLRTVEEGAWQLRTDPWQAACLWLRMRVAAAQEGPAAAVELLAAGVREGVLRWLVLEESGSAAWLTRCALEVGWRDVAHAVIEAMADISLRNPQLSAVRVAAEHVRALVDGDVEAVAEATRSYCDPWARAAAAEDHADLLSGRGEHRSAILELDRAMSDYAALGGERDVVRVRARLRALGVSRRHWKHATRPTSGWESLTETERKVAEVVAGGLTNQQAARHLFVSPNTVGTHLRQVYRKLGIRSRSALIRMETSRMSGAAT